MTLSIDQNSNPLWDTPAKLAALAASGESVRHCVEDIDVAFTDLGATLDDPTLRICREQFHPSGGQSWGASLFYSEFLGMEVFQTSSRSIMMRLNSTTTIACVESKTENVAGIYSHFGLDFETIEEIDAAYEIAVAQKEKYAIQKVTRP
ncbi:MAG: VOC family protein, partial [Phycisphaerales bacterium]|nr:VOC family protein [Phycisphaerales bacterium]